MTDYVTADHDIPSLPTFTLCWRSRLDVEPETYMVALDYSVPGTERQLAIVYTADKIFVVVFGYWVG